MKTKLTLEKLKTVVKTYLDPTKSGTFTFVESHDNLAGLIDKIGKIVTLDGKFYDKLPELSGDNLPRGKTVEEWYQDLILPVDYDENGTNALAPHNPSYLPVSYSYTCGRKVLPTSIRYDEYEKAVNTAEEYSDLITMNYKRVGDSEDLFLYGLKKQLISNAIKACNATLNPSKQYASTTAYEPGEFVKKDGSATKVGVIRTKLTSSEHGAWDVAVKNADIVELNLVTKMAVPTDTATGEAFIKAVKEKVEDSQFASEGNSLNGNTIGAEPGLFLFIKKGVMPTVEVETLAGAFHDEKLSFPAEVRVIDDFGDDTSAFAVLVDKRGLKLHNSYRATRENSNGEGDFLNLYRHTENTAFISRNTFIHIFEENA